MYERRAPHQGLLGQQWVMFGGKPQLKPLDPRERWRRECLVGGR